MPEQERREDQMPPDSDRSLHADLLTLKAGKRNRTQAVCGL
jgi:hypothetical protein